MEQSAGWRPQPRPEWVTSLNQVGGILGPPDLLISLDEDSLVDAAIRASGIEDFGGDAWREPFRVLLADMESQSELTLVGRVLARFDLLRCLVALLGMAEDERRHPEILEMEIEEPIFVTGLGRTGTTILHELLAQDPSLRSAFGWEQRYPSPPPDAATWHEDPRIAHAAADIDLWLQVVPEFLAVHESRSDGPDEDTVGQQLGFASQVWSATHRAPNFDAWLMGNAAYGMQFHRRLLQHLQFRKPGRWVLKAPTHMSCLPDLFAVYPDARVIHTHRDPLKVLASTADMIATLRWQRSDRVDYDEYAQTICFGFPFLLNMVIDQRTSGVLPADRIGDVLYADLIHDHLGTIASVYDQLGMELSDEAKARMSAYIESRPKGRHGNRDYRFSDLSVDEAEMRQRFVSYMEHYHVPNEEL